MDTAFCGLHNDKYTKNSPHKNCVNRACIESLTAREKFRISERKVQIIAMMGS
jgi:hypothetical protein